MSYDHVFELQNRSVAFFQHGYHDCAIANLMMALHDLPLFDLLGHSSPCERNSCECHHETSPTNQRRKFTPPCSTSFIEWVRMSEPGLTLDDGDTDEPWMYNYALVVNTEHYDWKTNGISHYSVKAALLYNLAFIYHWRAIHLGISSELPLALYHYEMALSAIQQELEHGAVVMDNHHLTLAVLNNMGHMHRQLLQFNQARRCLGFMQLLITSRRNANPTLSMLETMEDYEKLVINTMLPPPMLQLAPAA